MQRTSCRLIDALAFFPGISQGSKRPIETKQAIRRIELALQKLEQTPVGGTDLLQPLSSTNRRPVIPPGILAHSGPSGDSRSSSTRGFSGARGYPRRCDKNTRPRLNRL
ncbi:unnamed protein product [Echinostoma caproni]|uniref:Uncharacterized protein n=1 Tax=Echinostoma caproni TaxID=27848 RepID=A0A183B964_9TREM|nr:unnamed protein product [Echinostoma caproni]